MPDLKITGLTADTSPTSDDLIPTVTDPAGTPANRKVTLANAITKAHGLSDGAVVSVVSSALVSNAVTSSAAELNILDGATLDVTELNYVDGVTSGIQAQLDGKVSDTGDTMTGVLTIGVAGNALSLKNSTDSSSVQVAVFEGDRATMADNDEAYMTLRLSDDAGTQTEAARISWRATDVNAGTGFDGALEFHANVAGVLTKQLKILGNNSFGPNANDQMSLGVSGAAFSDLFLASGGVINWNAGDVTLTHSSNLLTLAGGGLDAGGADSREVPNGAGGTTVDAAGEICVDTTSDTLNFFDGTVEGVLNPIQSKTITIESPTAAEDLSMFYTDDAITITKIVFVITGSTSATTTIRHHTDRSNAGNEVVTGGTTANSTTTGNVVTSFNDATVPADSFVWLETTALSGTPTSLSVTVFYRQDA